MPGAALLPGALGFAAPLGLVPPPARWEVRAVPADEFGNVIRPTVGLALALGAALLLIDIGAWRLVSMLFDRERLVTGTKA